MTSCTSLQRCHMSVIAYPAKYAYICIYRLPHVTVDHSISSISWMMYNWHITITKHNKTLCISWWRHQMETFSALLGLCVGNSPVTGEFSSQRPVTRSFDVFFYLCLNTQLSKQSWGWWFETPSRPLWRHCNALHGIYCKHYQGIYTILGLCSLRRHRLIGVHGPIINLRRSSDHLRFIMGIPIPMRRCHFCE